MTTENNITIGSTHHLGGADYTYRLTGRETGGQGALIEVSVAPRTFFAIPHIHDQEEEWIYIIDGQCRAQLDGQTMDVSAGDTVFVPRGTPHALANAGDTTARLLFILTPAGMEPFFAETAATLTHQPHFPLEAFDDFNAYVTDMMQQFPEVGQTMGTIMQMLGKYHMRPADAE